MENQTIYIVAGVVAFVVVIIVISSITTIDAGTRGVVKTFGDVTNVFEEGLHFKTPISQRIIHMNVKTQRYEAEETASSKDLQTVSTQVVLNYRPEAQTVGKLVEEIGTDYVFIIIDPAVQESVKAATAQFTAEELITQRPRVKASIKTILVQRLSVRNVIVEDISITDFSFSPEFSRAIEEKQVAEQRALRAERDLQRVKIEAQQTVVQAEAEATAKLKVAEAEASALRLQREVITPALLQLRFVEKWDGELPTFLTGESGLVPLVNVQ